MQPGRVIARQGATGRLLPWAEGRLEPVTICTKTSSSVGRCSSTRATGSAAPTSGRASDERAPTSVRPKLRVVSG